MPRGPSRQHTPLPSGASVPCKVIVSDSRFGFKQTTGHSVSPTPQEESDDEQGKAKRLFKRAHSSRSDEEVVPESDDASLSDGQRADSMAMDNEPQEHAALGKFSSQYHVTINPAPL